MAASGRTEQVTRVGSAVLVLVAAVALAVTVAMVEPWDADGTYRAAAGVAALALLGVSMLLNVGGARRAIATTDLAFASNGETETVKRGDAIAPADVALLDPAQYEIERGLSFRALFVGADGRWSTSKLQALVWTYAIAWGLATLMIAERLGQPGGWNALVDGGMQETYLVLLGGPFAAAVAARAITGQAVANGTVDKGQVPQERTLAQGVRDVVSDDDGNADLFDFQYALFTLVAVVYFVLELWFSAADGLPAIPAVLAGLTSVSALSYVGKKATERAVPKLHSATPSRVAIGETITIRGNDLMGAGGGEPVVEIGGYEAGPLLLASPSVVQVAVPARVGVGEAVTVGLVTNGGFRVVEPLHVAVEAARPATD